MDQGFDLDHCHIFRSDMFVNVKYLYSCEINLHYFREK